MQKKIFGQPRMQISKDGSTLASVDGRIFDLIDKRNDIVPLSNLAWEKYAKLYPERIAINPTGRYVVTAHMGMVYAKNVKADYLGGGRYRYDPMPEPENLILVWDTVTGELVYQDSFTMVYKTPATWTQLDDFSKFIHVEFLSNDKFVTVSDSGEVAVWSIPLKKRIYALSAAAIEASVFAVNHSQEQFVILEGNPIRLFADRIGQQAITSRLRRFEYWNRVLGAGYYMVEPLQGDSVLRIWTLADGRLIKEVEKPTSGIILSIHFSPDDNLLAMNDHQAIYLLDIESGILIDRLPIACNLLGFTDDGQNLLVHRDNRLSIWNIQQERFYKNFSFTGIIYNAQMLTDNRVALATTDGTDSIVHVIELGALIVERAKE